MNGTRQRGSHVVAAACVLLAGFPCAFALNPALDVSQYAHTPWKIRDGFTKGSIRSIAQTPDGYLWLGTEFGLLRFDGVRTVPWQQPPNQHLPSSEVMKLLVSADGTLWIGTREGLASWKSGALTLYAELAGMSMTVLLQARDGSTWAGGTGIPTGRLCAIRMGSVECSGADGSLGHGVYGLYEDGKGSLWAGGIKGFWRWRPGPPKFYPMPEENTIQSFDENNNGTLMIGTRNGIAQMAGGKPEPYPLPGIAEKFFAYTMLRDREGGLWIGTRGGLVHLHQGRVDLFRQSDGLSGDSVSALFEDREGNIWAATLGGLDRFREYAVATFSGSEGLSTLVVSSVLADKDGSVWLGASDGLKRWRERGVTTYRERDGSSVKGAAASAAQQEMVREIFIGALARGAESLFQDARGRILVATSRGIGTLENDRFIPINGIPATNVQSIAEDTQGNLWIADQDHGLLRYSPENKVEQIPWSSLGRKDAIGLTLAGDSQGGLWIGLSAGGGVVYFKEGQVKASYTRAEGLGQGLVRHLRLDRYGALWAATEGGLSRIKNGRAATLTLKNGLPCEAIQWAMEDDAGSFWLNTPCGLVRITRAELRAWTDAVDRNQNANRIVQTRAFDSSDGVRSTARGGFYSPLVGKSTDGRLWFGGVDGAGVVDPLHLPFNRLPPPVLVESVKVNGNEVAAADGMELSRGSNDLQIDYTALSFTNPERVHFRYKLEGKDADWQDVGTRRQAYYDSLAPKKYRFRVIASNNDGVWNEAGATLNFSIVPAYHQTIWFQGLCVAAGAGWCGFCTGFACGR